MWRILSITVVVCVVCLFSIKAQTVNEAESSIILNETMADVSLVVENEEAKVMVAPLRFEIK